jgi:hypothetical protein
MSGQQTISTVPENAGRFGSVSEYSELTCGSDSPNSANGVSHTSLGQSPGERSPKHPKGLKACLIKLQYHPNVADFFTIKSVFHLWLNKLVFGCFNERIRGDVRKEDFVWRV